VARGEAAGGTGAAVERKELSIGQNREREVS